MGVGVPGGCEAIIHAVSAIFHDPHTATNKKWILQVDMRNAFNLVDRETIFKEVREHLPEIAKWVEYSYGCQPPLHFGTGTILSCMGVHQGDPLGSLLFALALQPLLKLIKDSVPDLVLNVWYLDDGNIIGTPDQLKRVIDILVKEGPPCGLHLRPEKSSVWCGDPSKPADPLSKGVPSADPLGIELLGAPVGTPSFASDIIMERISSIREIVLSKLPLLEDSQAEFMLLRACYALPKFAYCLRTSNPSHHQDDFAEFDGVQRDALGVILASPIKDTSWLQATLPVSLGVLGLRSALRHSHASWLSSLSLTSPLITSILGKNWELRLGSHVAISLARLSLATNQHWSRLGDLEETTQHDLSTLIDLKVHGDVMASDLGVRDKARLNALTLPHCGDWLNALPNPYLGLALHDQEFRLAAQYRLGLPVYDDASPCPSCTRPSDIFGDHAISCATDGERIFRHDRLRDAIYDAASSAALAPKREAPHLFPDSTDRPGDVFIPSWRNGRGAALDVTVTSPLQVTQIRREAAEAGAALQAAKKWKMDRYFER